VGKFAGAAHEWSIAASKYPVVPRACRRAFRGGRQDRPFEMKLAMLIVDGDEIVQASALMAGNPRFGVPEMQRERSVLRWRRNSR